LQTRNARAPPSEGWRISPTPMVGFASRRLERAWRDLGGADGGIRSAVRGNGLHTGSRLRAPLPISFIEEEETMKTLRRVPLALGLASACLAVLVARGGSAAHAVSPPPTFGQPTIAGIGGVGFEEDIRVDNAGRVYTSVPGALSSDTSWVWRSTDDGKTFKWVPAAAPLTGKFGSCAGGGDTELATDSADYL